MLLLSLFWLFSRFGIASAKTKDFHLNYDTGIYYPLETQVVTETADLFIRVNISMPHIDDSNLNCSIDQNENIQETVTFINQHYRRKFTELSKNFGIEVENLDLIKNHFCDCRRSPSEFYCGYPSLSCCALKNDEQEVLRCVHDTSNKQVFMNLDKQHYTSKCFKLETPLHNNVPDKRYFVGAPTLLRNEIQHFKTKSDYETRFPYDWDQFRRIRDMNIDSTVFMDAIEEDKLTLNFTPTWLTNKGYGCVNLLMGANSYEEDSSTIFEKFRIKVFINDTIPCSFYDTEFFDPKTFDVRMVMFNCPIKRISNIIIKIDIVDNCRFHEVLIHRSTCGDVIDFYRNKRTELQQIELEPIEDLPLSPPIFKNIRNDEEELPLSPPVLDQISEASEELPLSPPIRKLNSNINEGSAFDNFGMEASGSYSLTDDSDYVSITKEFFPIDNELIPDSDYTYQFVKIKRKQKRSVFSTMGQILQYYTYGGPYTNLYNINKFQKIDARLEKIKEILAINIQNMERLTHSLQQDMTAITDLICEMTENFEIGLIKLRASLMMIDLKFKLSEFYGQCNGRQVPFLYSNLIRQFLCTVNVKSCQTLVKLVNCEIAHIRLTGHSVGQLHLDLKLSIPIVDNNLKIFKRIDLPKPIQNETTVTEFTNAEILKDSLDNVQNWAPFRAKNTHVAYRNLVFQSIMPKFLVLNTSDNTIFGETEHLQNQDFLLTEDLKQSCVEFRNDSIISECAKFQITKVHEKCYIRHIDSIKQIYVVSEEDVKVINEKNEVRTCKTCLLKAGEKTYDCQHELVNEPVKLELEFDVRSDPILLDEQNHWDSYNRMNEQLRQNISTLDEQVNFKVAHKLLESLNYTESNFWIILGIIVFALLFLITACVVYVLYRKYKNWRSENLGSEREFIELITNRNLRTN